MDVKGLLIAALLFLAALAWFGNRSIYFPMKYPEGDWNQGATDFWIETQDKVRIHGWYSAASSNRVVLFLHGNAGNVTHRTYKMERLNAAGLNVLVIDWRGYGRSEGWPTEAGLRKDARAAYERLKEKGFDASRILLYGESLGTTVATLLAAEVPCAALVLEAPFPSVQAVAGKVLPLLGPLLVRGYNAEAVIGRVSVPKLFIHGDRDEVIDLALGQRLFKAAAEPKEFWLVGGAGHNDIAEVAGEQYTERLRGFAERVWPGR